MKTCIESISVQHRQTFDIQMLIYTCRFDIVSIEGSRYLYADIFARLSLRCRKTCVDLISMQHRQIFYVQMLIYRFDIVSIEGSRYLYADIYTIVTTRYWHIDIYSTSTRYWISTLHRYRPILKLYLGYTRV